MKNNGKLLLLCLLTLVIFGPFSSKGTIAEEYEDTPTQTKTVVITNTTLTDIAFELFTVDKWGKMISNFTWDGGYEDALEVRVNFWTIELNEALQADYGDLGVENLYHFTTFPEVASYECKPYWVDDGKLPVTIYYEVDKTKNSDHEIENGTNLTLTVKYYNLKGEDATKDGPAAEEYEDTPTQTKTVVITNTTQTDIAVKLFTVDKWGKMISNFTWDGRSGDNLEVRVNFWTIELKEALQADYGDLGVENLYDFLTFPEVASYECKPYWVEDEEPPVTIYYEVDKTKNSDHEIENGTTLTLTVNYYYLKGEDATEDGLAEEEYEDTAAQTKTVIITNTTQTDIAIELFTVDTWGKMISNFTWDGESGDNLDVRVNFWTIELKEANQADYGDLGVETLYDFQTFPEVASYECRPYWVDDEEPPVTIYYEVDKTKNSDHEVENGTTLTLTVKYYNLKDEETTSSSTLQPTSSIISSSKTDSSTTTSFSTRWDTVLIVFTVIFMLMTRNQKKYQ